MMVTYKFAGFRKVEEGEDGESILLEHSLDEIPQVPEYVDLEISEDPEE